MQFLGQLFAGWFADRYGRTKSIYLMIFNVYIGVMTEVLSQNKNDYTGAKIIMGSATGIMQVVIYTYVASHCQSRCCNCARASSGRIILAH
jgi:MFS family permease